MFPDDEKRIDNLTKQLPILNKVPRDARLGIVRKAHHSYGFIGTIIVFVFILIHIFAKSMVAYNIGDAIFSLILPIFGTLLLMIFAVAQLRFYLVEKYVKEFQAAHPELATQNAETTADNPDYALGGDKVHAKSVFKKLFIVLGVIVILLGGFAFYMFRTVPKNVAISPQQFTTTMEKHGFKMLAPQENFVNVYQKAHPEVQKIYLASKKTERGNKVFFMFATFSSNDGARKAFASAYSSIKNDAANSQNLVKKFTNESGLFGNTQYYDDIHATGKWETVMFSVDNTFLRGHSDEHPNTELREICKEFGYKEQ